ncbi:unnamed protein product [Prorocentrum cordatum]|uniref:Uncharacterized protein n=1 Tax=Prorocentrum cordatum TaxID=2364126 RepID=A0ABN9R9A5_9DINO|nr:unnamed protein product [Polarella glacialis]
MPAQAPAAGCCTAVRRGTLSVVVVEDPLGAGAGAGRCSALVLGYGADWALGAPEAGAHVVVNGREVPLGSAQLAAVPGERAVLLHSPLDPLAPQLLLERPHREDVRAVVLATPALTPAARSSRVRPDPREAFVAVPVVGAELEAGAAAAEGAFAPANCVVFFQPSGRRLVQLDVARRCAREVALGEARGPGRQLHRGPRPSVAAAATERGVEVLVCEEEPAAEGASAAFLAVLFPSGPASADGAPRPPTARWVEAHPAEPAWAGAARERAPAAGEAAALPVLAADGLFTTPFGTAEQKARLEDGEDDKRSVDGIFETMQTLVPLEGRVRAIENGTAVDSADTAELTAALAQLAAEDKAKLTAALAAADSKIEAKGKSAADLGDDQKDAIKACADALTALLGEEEAAKKACIGALEGSPVGGEEDPVKACAKALEAALGGGEKEHDAINECVSALHAALGASKVSEQKVSAAAPDSARKACADRVKAWSYNVEFLKVLGRQQEILKYTRSIDAKIVLMQGTCMDLSIEWMAEDYHVISFPKSSTTVHDGLTIALDTASTLELIEEKHWWLKILSGVHFHDIFVFSQQRFYVAHMATAAAKKGHGDRDVFAPSIDESMIKRMPNFKAWLSISAARPGGPLQGAVSMLFKLASGVIAEPLAELSTGMGALVSFPASFSDGEMASLRKPGRGDGSDPENDAIGIVDEIINRVTGAANQRRSHARSRWALVQAPFDLGKAFDKVGRGMLWDTLASLSDRVRLRLLLEEARNDTYMLLQGSRIGRVARRLSIRQGAQTGSVDRSVRFVILHDVALMLIQGARGKDSYQSAAKLAPQIDNFLGLGSDCVDL